MNKFIINKQAFFKNVLFRENNILASDEDYGSEAVFSERMASGKKGKLDTHVNISYTDVHKIIPYPDKLCIQVFYDNNKSAFDFEDTTSYNEVLNYMLRKKPLQPATEKAGNIWITIAKPALYTLAVVILSAVLIIVAKAIEEGGTMEVSGGSRRGMKRLIIGLAEVLGFWGSVAVGILATGGMLYYTISQFKASKIEMTVYR